eukprot:gene43353-53826_t
MLSHKGPEFVKAFQNNLVRLQALGHKPSVQRLDSESSGVLEKFMREQNSTMEFVPPNNHRANRAERAIQDFKNHIISALAGCHESFPPICGTSCFHKSPPTRASTANSTTFSRTHSPPAACMFYARLGHLTESPPGFYLGPALSHNRSFRVYVVSTQASDTLAWFPKTYHMPDSSAIEFVHAGIRDLAAALQALSRTDNITAGLRQPFDQPTNTLSTNLRDIVMFQSSAVMEESKKKETNEERCQLTVWTCLPIGRPVFGQSSAP